MQREVRPVERRFIVLWVNQLQEKHKSCRAGVSGKQMVLTKEFFVADSSLCIVYLLKVLARACSRCGYKLYCLTISTAIICSIVDSDFKNGL